WCGWGVEGRQQRTLRRLGGGVATIGHRNLCRISRGGRSCHVRPLRRGAPEESGLLLSVLCGRLRSRAPAAPARARRDQVAPRRQAGCATVRRAMRMRGAAVGALAAAALAAPGSPPAGAAAGQPPPPPAPPARAPTATV